MVCSGLYCTLRDQPYQLPLHHARIDASLYDLCAEVKVQQTFVNDAPPSFPPLECFYTFPLDEESAVFSFVCDLDGAISRGKIKEKSEARAEYHSAVSQNQSAMLLEQKADNVFQCRVGSLRPGSVCTITVTYLTLLDQEGRSNRFTLPMIVAPKYTPRPQGPTPPFGDEAPVTANMRIHSGFECDHCLCTPIIGTRHYCTVCANYNLCDGCSRQPGLHDADHTMSTCTDPATGKNEEKADEHPLTRPEGCGQPATIEGKLRDLTINMSVRMPSPILSIRCPSHAEETRIQREPGYQDYATVSFHSTSSSSLSCDFILLVEQEHCFDPRVLCELDVANRSAAISLAFFPPALDMLSASQLRCELIFLIDCSGSMRGSSISCVRKCMHILLRSLPVNSRFNVIVFGSSWSSLFSSSQVYDDKSLSAATEYVAHLQADLGGTEIYPPLHHALTSGLLDTHPRQIFLLTDGQVSNVQQLAQLTSQHAANTRLFTFGIGTEVDRALCKKLAQAGQGKCEFVTATDAQGGDMREKIVRQVTRAMQPVLTDVKVNWKELNPDGHKDNKCSSVEGGAENPNITSNEGVASVSFSSSANPIPGCVAPSCTASFLQCPSVAPAIFMNSRFVLHALNACLPESVWKQVQTGQEPTLQLEIEITGRSNHPHESDCMRRNVLLTGKQITQAAVIHTIAAQARIRELEDHAIPKSDGETKKEVENEILQLALRHSLTSSRTSFVIVYHTGKEEEMQLQPPEDNFMGFSSRRYGRSINSLRMSTPPPPLFGANASPQSFARFAKFSFSGQPDNSSCSFGAATVSKNAPVHAQHSYFGGGMATFEMTEQKLSAEESNFEDLIKLQSASGVWNITPTLINIVHAIQPSSTITAQFLQAIGGKYGVDQEVVGVL